MLYKEQEFGLRCIGDPSANGDHSHHLVQFVSGDADSTAFHLTVFQSKLVFPFSCCTIIMNGTASIFFQALVHFNHRNEGSSE